MNLPTPDETMAMFKALQRAQDEKGQPMFSASDLGHFMDFFRKRGTAGLSADKLGVLLGVMDGMLRGPRDGWCCKMREKFLIGCVGEASHIPEPVDVADFIDFEAKSESGKPVILTKFCPFCGRRILPGQLRVFEDGSGGG